MPCRRMMEARLSGICLASGFPAQPTVFAVSWRHGDMWRKHVCRWARMRGIALSLLLPRLGKPTAVSCLFFYFLITPPCTLSIWFSHVCFSRGDCYGFTCHHHPNSEPRCMPTFVLNKGEKESSSSLTPLRLQSHGSGAI